MYIRVYSVDLSEQNVTFHTMIKYKEERLLINIIMNTYSGNAWYDFADVLRLHRDGYIDSVHRTALEYNVFDNYYQAISLLKRIIRKQV